MKPLDNNRVIDRFKGITWFNQISDKEILIGGAGGLGSWLALDLARKNMDIIIYDMDTLEEHNLGGQFFHKGQIGKPKVVALQESIALFADKKIEVLNEEYTLDSMVSPIMTSCFDNMEVRRLFFENWASQEDRNLFIDGRMGAEQFTVLFVKKGFEDAYRDTLFNSSDLKEAPCTAKSTQHCTISCVNKMVQVLCNYFANVELDEDIREVFFRYDEDLVTGKRSKQLYDN